VLTAAVWLGALVAVAPGEAQAQAGGARLELGGQAVWLNSSEFGAADVGFGARFAWLPSRILGIEAEGSLYPGDFPDRGSFSRARSEGLFGVTIGPRLGRLRPFAKLRPGFVRFREPSDPIVCILIFPPPLACVLARGRTLMAVDVGGGVEVGTAPGTFVRVEVGDRLIRYPGPVFGPGRRAREDGFVGHDVRIAAGAGFRF
jgi:hypothetical protein